MVHLGANSTDTVCAIYARVSTEQQAKGDSVEHQVSMIREFVRSQKLGVIPDEFIFEDEGFSASKFSIWERPAMKRLMEDAQAQKFQIILFKGISRFARSVEDALEAINVLKGLGLRIISLEESFDSAKANDSKFFFTIHSAMAEYEAAKTGIRVRMGNIEKARKGEWIGQPPFGYILGAADKKLHVDVKYKHVVEEIFHLYVNQGWGTFKIAENLNEKYYLPRSGKRWSRGTVSQILKNPAYMGRIVYNKTNQKRERDYRSDPRGRKKWKRYKNEISDWIIVDGAHEAMISHEMFEQAQRILQGRRVREEASNIRHPLTGILKCGKCGEGMVCQRRTYKEKSYRYYICKTYHKYGRSQCDQANVNGDQLEKYISERLGEYLRAICSDSLLHRITASPGLQRNISSKMEELTYIQQEIEKLNKQTSVLFQERNNMNQETYDYIMRELHEKTEQHIARRGKLHEELQVAHEDRNFLQELEILIDHFLKVQLHDQDELRQIMHFFIEKITVADDQVLIQYKFRYDHVEFGA